MLGERLREWSQVIRAPLGRWLGRLGISPNALTIIGFLLHIPALYLLAVGHWRWGGVWVAVASAFDALDGSVAREMGWVTTFGAFLDSVLDRFSEAVVYLGLFLWYWQRGGRPIELPLIYIAIVGSLMVSYTRARAEGVGIPCKEGLFTRFERIVLLVLALLLRQVSLMLWVMAGLTIWTALQRVMHVRRACDHLPRQP